MSVLIALLLWGFLALFRPGWWMLALGFFSLLGFFAWLGEPAYLLGAYVAYAFVGLLFWLTQMSKLSKCEESKPATA